MQTHMREPTEEGDDLPFGAFCFSCGNATQGSPYCSAECRKADLDRSEASPDFSPSLSAVPPLVHSAKSVCSTPPSSATTSPSPPDGMIDDLADPPALDLPPPKHHFEYGGQSLPNVGLRFPSTWTINYTPDLLASPAVNPADVPSAKPAKDLNYRRRPNRPQSAVPSPLYFRQKAAAVHSSPAFGPVSPISRFATPFTGPVDFSGAHVHEDDIVALSLPAREETTSAPPFVPTPVHCGRHGCVGVPARPQIDTSVAGVTSKAGRRQSWQGQNGPIKALTPLEVTDEVLLSPRIRALRTGRSPTDENRRAEPAPRSVEVNSNDDDAHSAFACYLFSHLSAEPAPERGRSSSIDQTAADMQRSRSVDAALATRAAVGNSTTASPARPVRPIRGMMGGRGPAAGGPIRSEPALLPLTPATVETSDADLSDGSSRNSRNHDRDATVRPPVDRRGRSERVKLTPGHFISATSETPSSSSPFASPPASPPTAGRGRSHARTYVNSGLVDGVAESFNPRGRSKLRGFGAVQRSLSPSARKESPSPDRSRGRTRSRSRSRTQTRQQSRTSCSRGRGAERDESPRRGRTRERVVREDEDEVGAAPDEDEDDERGRGRGRRSSRSRSRSKLRRGRGREVVYSMAAYGHLDSSDESDRGR
ncbi:hypothetical protein JCM10207_004076 [Rhodosporidiobolus poonsookiae]